MTEGRARIDHQLKQLQSLHAEHGLRAAALVPDLAFIGLLDDVVDAAEAAIDLLRTSRPYRAYSMARVAFEAAQRLLVLATADDYVGLGTRAWLYYQAKDEALRGGDDAGSGIPSIKDQLLTVWTSHCTEAAAIMQREGEVLRRLRRGSPDNFLGEDLAAAVDRAYERIAADRKNDAPDNSARVNRAVYRSLSRDTHACLRLEPSSIRIDSEGYVQVTARPRDPKEIRHTVHAALSPVLVEAAAAVSYRIHQRQIAHASRVKQSAAGISTPHRLGYRPDYGLQILKMGVAHSTMVFPGAPIKVLCGLADGSLSSSLGMSIEGTEHIATFDFRGDTLRAVLDMIAERFPSLATSIATVELGARVELPEPILCTIHAQLGELQSNDMESFVPLVVVRLA